MAAKGQRGIKGTPHWKVEAEVRGRTGLTAAWCLQSASWVVTQLITPALRGPLCLKSSGSLVRDTVVTAWEPITGDQGPGPQAHRS